MEDRVDQYLDIVDDGMESCPSWVRPTFGAVTFVLCLPLTVPFFLLGLMSQGVRHEC